MARTITPKPRHVAPSAELDAWLLAVTVRSSCTVSGHSATSLQTCKRLGRFSCEETCVHAVLRLPLNAATLNLWRFFQHVSHRVTIHSSLSRCTHKCITSTNHFLNTSLCMIRCHQQALFYCSLPSNTATPPPMRISFTNGHLLEKTATEELAISGKLALLPLQSLNPAARRNEHLRPVHCCWPRPRSEEHINPRLTFAPPKLGQCHSNRLHLPASPLHHTSPGPEALGVARHPPRRRCSTAETLFFV